MRALRSLQDTPQPSEMLGLRAQRSQLIRVAIASTLSLNIWDDYVRRGAAGSHTLQWRAAEVLFDMQKLSWNVTLISSARKLILRNNTSGQHELSDAARANPKTRDAWIVKVSLRATHIFWKDGEITHLTNASFHKSVFFKWIWWLRLTLYCCVISSWKKCKIYIERQYGAYSV